MNNLIPLLILAFLLSACVTEPVKKSPPPDPTLPAQALLESGKTLEAAEYYQQLAEQSQQRRDLYRLLAAQTYLKSGNTPEALIQAEQVNPSALSASQRNHLKLLQAQIYLSLGDAEKALEYLDLISLKQLNSTEKSLYHQSRAFAYSLTGQLLQSARQRILLGRFLTDPIRINDNNTAIFETLDLLSIETLQSEQPPAPDQLGGWMALTALLKQRNQNPENFELELTRWQHLYPGHPAGQGFLAQYLEQQQHHFQMPHAIAVLLPESGPYASAAASIRQGFDAAYRSDPEMQKPQVRFYDSSSSDPGLLYQQVVSAGADLIIGPLQKQTISQLVEGRQLNIPVLALNHVPGLEKKNLYQFGLSPIDEAEQLTVQAQSNGASRALVLVPDNDYGHRINEYFIASWQDKAGLILETEFYKPKSNDFSAPIKRLLNIDESEARFRRIQRMIPGIKFSPRTRTDAQALFLSDSAKTLRLLNPQLHFYRARNIPAYATSKAYSNRPSPNLDIDLNGLTFCSLPWILDHDYLGELSINQLKQNNQQFPPSRLNLIALGIDSYNLLPYLNDMDRIAYDGATGRLMLSADLRIKRDLSCAEFVNGAPSNLAPVVAFENPSSLQEEQEEASINPAPDSNPFHEQQ